MIKDIMFALTDYFNECRVRSLERQSVKLEPHIFR